MANEAQRAGWDGPGGSYWAAHADRFDAEMAGYQPGLLAAALAGLDPGGAVLDVGCGAGRTSLDLAPHAGSVTGVDLSTELLRVARARAEGVPNVRFVQADAQTDDLGGGYDLVVSRNGVMLFDDPVLAFTALARSLVPGGRLVFQVWQSLARNEWLGAVAAILEAGGVAATPPERGPSPLGFSDPALVREVLGAAGFVDVSLTGVEQPMWFGADVEEAFAFVTGLRAALFAELAGPERERAEAALRADLAAHAGSDGVRYASAAWIVRAGVP